MTLFALMTMAYAAMVAALWSAQELMIFPGSQAFAGVEQERAALAAASGVNEVWVPREDGSKLLLWHMPAQHDRVVVYLHGNGAMVAHALPLANFLREQGWNTVAMEFRGYGTDGKPSEAALAEDLRRTIDWLVAQGFSREHIVIHGRSVGGGVAGTAAGQIEVGGWVFESTFDSVRNMASSRFWFMPVRWLLRSPLDTASRVGAIRAPILQIHSHVDEVVPWERGRELAAAMPGHAEFIEVTDQSHNVLMSVTHPRAREAYLRLLASVAP